MSEQLSLLPAALRLAEQRGAAVDPTLSYGLRAVRPDFTSSHDYRWPFPGKWARAAGPFLDHQGACPRDVGDGICAGLTWQGIASGGISAQLVLLIGWRPGDVLGSDSNKIRVKRARVVECFTLAALLVERKPDDESLNLRGADLRGVDLYGADLRGVDLYGVDLRRADLRRADLRRADLYGADLRGADLRGVDLRGVDLYGADLRRADLRGVDLYGADLRRADLRGSVDVPQYIKAQQ